METIFFVSNHKYIERRISDGVRVLIYNASREHGVGMDEVAKWIHEEAQQSGEVGFNIKFIATYLEKIKPIRASLIEKGGGNVKEKKHHSDLRGN